jgi:uncharacterized small protein (DUF1192 family)
MAEKCECLNFCGDDPYVHDGRVEPCAKLKKQQAQLKEHRRLQTIVAELPQDTIQRLKANQATKRDCRLASAALIAAKKLLPPNIT